MWVFFKVSWVFAGFGEILVISVNCLVGSGYWVFIVLLFYWMNWLGLCGWCCFNELCSTVLLGWLWFLDL
jgi:hypothetical protein